MCLRIGLAACFVAVGFAFGQSPPPQAPSSKHTSGEPGLIVPGLRVGALKLGDNREQAFEALHLQPGQVYEFLLSGCGGGWYSAADPRSRGTLFFYVREGSVYQIDAEATRYRTVDGITVSSTAAEVRSHYKSLRAYSLANFTSGAIGDRPLIYWVDASKGIAFAFAYSRDDHKRYLWAIIVFQPDAGICPFGGTMEPDDKRELAPYTLELPDDNSP